MPIVNKRSAGKISFWPRPPLRRRARAPFGEDVLAEERGEDRVEELLRRPRDGRQAQASVLDLRLAHEGEVLGRAEVERVKVVVADDLGWDVGRALHQRRERSRCSALVCSAVARAKDLATWLRVSRRSRPTMEDSATHLTGAMREGWRT